MINVTTGIAVSDCSIQLDLWISGMESKEPILLGPCIAMITATMVTLLWIVVPILNDKNLLMSFDYAIPFGGLLPLWQLTCISKIFIICAHCMPFLENSLSLIFISPSTLFKNSSFLNKKQVIHHYLLMSENGRINQGTK